MYDKVSFDLLIECRCCDVENLITDYVPSMHIYCSQCRERLMDDDILETHCEFTCQECSMKMVLLKDTEVKIGRSVCACGSADLRKVGKTTLLEEAAKAGGLIGRGEDEEGILEDTDWLRSDPGSIDDEDYEDMFNQDPGQN